MDNRYQSMLTSLLDKPAYSLKQHEKTTLLLPMLEMLHDHHRKLCAEYSNIVSENATRFSSLEEIPYLAVRLFKLLSLKSVKDNEVFRVLRSSGTTGQAPAQVFLDRDTSARQSKVLVNILQNSIGKARLPMLIIDSQDIVTNKQAFSARAAGIQGLMFFGRDHTYALDSNMRPNWDRIHAFCKKYQDVPVLVFGFTFMVWQYWIEELLRQSTSLNLHNGVLLHSGGWKKLADKAVSNDKFKRQVKDATGIRKIVNFYGMAEQVGSVFTECEHGHLHAPNMADVIVRDPYTLEPANQGETGLLQVLSVVPTSYPGHSILTEDMGRILGEDNCPCGRKGRYIAIEGRLPQTEMRGCSDTHGAG